tara:strand:- start:2981 stop:3253 length:273 start_codon:yes stop_codon:yes gene_type:complete
MREAINQQLTRMGIGLIGKAAGDQQTHRLTNQSPAVLVCAKYLGAYSKSLQHHQQLTRMGIGCLQQARLANESRVELPALVPSRVGECAG